MDIQAINIGQGVALTSDNNTLPIDTYLDSEGDECSPNDNVAAVVVQGPDGFWYSVLTSDYENVTVH